MEYGFDNESQQIAFTYAGAIAPEQIVFQIDRNQDSDFDLSTVIASGNTLLVTRGDGTTVTWLCTVEQQSSDSLTLVHVFALGDVPAADTLAVMPILVVPGGTRRGRPVGLQVRGVDDIRGDGWR